MKPVLSILYVNWNTRELLADSIRSVVENAPSRPYEIVIVDNSSTDDSLERAIAVDTGDAQVRVIRNKDNPGFAAANNQAIRATDSPYVLLLNPDTLVRPDALDRMLDAIEGDATIGMVGPRLVYRNGSMQVSAQANPPHALGILVDGWQLFRLVPQPRRGEWLLGRHWAHDRTRDVPMVIGAAMLVRRAAIADAGEMEERFGMYAEDDEWCWRLRRSGWRILFLSEAVVVHFGSESAKTRWKELERNRTIATSRLRYVRVSTSWWNVLAVSVATLAAYGPIVAARRLFGVTRVGDAYIEAACEVHGREILGLLGIVRRPSEW